MGVNERTHLTGAGGAPSSPLQVQGVDMSRATKATVDESVVNIAKVCIGTGMLALPFAVHESGVVAGAGGLALIGLWNHHASKRLCGLRARLQCDTYASLAAQVFGTQAALVVDFCTIATLLGVVCVYTITFAQLLHDTPLALSPGGVATSAWQETIFCAVLVLPLSVWRELKFLANTSRIGLGALLAGFGAIFYFGVLQFGWWGFGDIDGRDAGLADAPTFSTAPFPSSSLSLWPTLSCSTDVSLSAAVGLFPQSVNAASRYFGVAAFCFGVPPLQFSLQDSMAEPARFTEALRAALAVVWAAYGVCGVGM